MELKKPPPYRIFDDTGNAFTMGCVAGGLFNFFKGLKNSPKGERLIGGIKMMKSRAPILGGNFAVWSGLHTTLDCILIKIRGKEDPINGIISGFLTGGILAARGGTKAIWNSAFFGGTILSFIESFSVYMNQKNSLKQRELMRTPYPPSLYLSKLKNEKVVVYDNEKKSKEFDFVPDVKYLKKIIQKKKQNNNKDNNNINNKNNNINNKNKNKNKII